MLFPRLPYLALAFAAGTWLASQIGTPAQAALLALTGLVLALTVPVRALAVRLVLVILLIGAGRMAAERMLAQHVPALPPGVAADDRALDRITGTVAGAIEDIAGQRRFLLVAQGAGARIWVTTQLLVPAVLPGDRIAIHGRLRTPRGYRVPGAVDMSRVSAGRGADLVVSAHEIQVLATGWSPWRWPVAVQRDASTLVASRGGDPAGNAAARAMVLGDRAALATALDQSFRDAGVSHVLSVSGLHLAVVAMLVFAAVRRAWSVVPALAMRVEPARAAAFAAAPSALAFTAITGAHVPTVRALLVVLIVLAGAATARRARIIDALGAAALVLLCLEPWSLFDPSFQLSFAATAILAVTAASPREPATLARRVVRAVYGLARASLWVTLATLPFSALSFGQVATGGLVANLAVVPLTELAIVPVGLLGVVLSLLWDAGGGVLIDVAVLASGLVVDIAGAVARVAPVLPLWPPTSLELGAFAVSLVAAVCGTQRVWPARTALAVAALGVLVLAGSHVACAWLGPAWRAHVRITFLDVGQGDAAVVELPGGGVWLIDSGGLPFVAHAEELDQAERQRRAEAPGAQSVARFLADRRIDRIDVVVLSHPHPDHYEGLRAVARTVDIGAIWVARPVPDARDAAAAGPLPHEVLLGELAARGTRVVHPVLGQPLHRHGAMMAALAPRYLDDTAAADPVASINDNSLIVRVSFAGRSVLFTGDLEHEGEELLVRQYGPGLRADLVKVPHHGSATSSTAALVKATSPAWAIISCGVANRFGFPAPAVVARWQDAGAHVLRTDQAGAVTAVIAPDGRMRVETFDLP